jgi:hypothetical protein
MTANNEDFSLADEAELGDLARKRANPRVRRAVYEFCLLIMFGLLVVHEGAHLIASILVGWDFASAYVRLEFPFMRIFWPNAPAISEEPTQWFIVLLAGGLAEGVFYMLLSLKRRYMIPMAVYAFIYALFESTNLYIEYALWLSVLYLSMIATSIIWLERSIDQEEFNSVRIKTSAPPTM